MLLEWQKRLRLGAAAIIAVAVLSSRQSLAQTPRPAFDVVSIKVNKNSGVGSVNLTQPGGHLTASNVSLKFLIIQAYQFEKVHFGSDPAGVNWIDTEHFDIEAEVDGNPTVEQKRLMIQSLLADRFKLAMHHETRQLPEYALVVSKAGRVGPQLQPHSVATKCIAVPAGEPMRALAPGEPIVAPCGGVRTARRTELVGQNITMKQLAQTLSVLLDRDAVDQTGLNGNYDLTLHYQLVPVDPDGTAIDPSGPPSIFTALQEQLGLKLQSIKGPIDVQVIDHVEQPSEN